MDVHINHVGMSLYLDFEHAEYGFHEIICSYFNLEESFLKPKLQMCCWLQQVMWKVLVNWMVIKNSLWIQNFLVLCCRMTSLFLFGKCCLSYNTVHFNPAYPEALDFLGYFFITRIFYATYLLDLKKKSLYFFFQSL